VDRVEVLGATRRIGLDADLLELGLEVGDDVRDRLFALGALLRDALGDVAVGIGVEIAQREVFEIPLHAPDPQPVRDRGVDLDRSRAIDCCLTGGRLASVRMLCRRSASLMMMTRMSLAIARNILRRFSTCASSLDW